MVVTILPLFLIYSVGLTPFAFGVVDGIYQGGTAVARLAGGFVADRTRRHKEVAAAGYAISAVSRLALLATGTWAAIAAVIAVDRAGKGLRTAPRDALISLSSRPESLGQSFGVHRALDTAGAMLGPLVAFALLALMVDPFEAVFVLSFLFGVIGLAILLLFVRNRPVAVPGAPRLTLRKAGAILQVRPFRSLVGGRHAARPRHGQRRLHVPRARAARRDPDVRLPAALRRHGARLHGARRPGRAARRLDRTPPGVSRRLRPAARRVRAPARRPAGRADRAARAAPLRRLLRGDRRRPPRPREHDDRAGGACDRARGARNRHRRRAARRLARRRRGLDVGGPGDDPGTLRRACSPSPSSSPRSSCGARSGRWRRDRPRPPLALRRHRRRVRGRRRAGTSPGWRRESRARKRRPLRRRRSFPARP